MKCVYSSQKFIFIQIAVLLTFISVSAAQTHYEIEKSFIETMPAVAAHTDLTTQSIQRLNAGMMSRGTAREIPFSTRLWRESASLCTNGSLYKPKKGPITAKKFIPFSRNIIMQANGLRNREEAYFYSFSREGFKSQRIALYQFHHFFLMRAAQISQGMESKESKQTNEKLVDKMSKVIYSDLIALQEILPFRELLSSINPGAIKRSLIRFNSLFFHELRRQNIIQQKVAARAAPSWVNEDQVAFLWRNMAKKLTKLDIAVNSPLEREFEVLDKFNFFRDITYPQLGRILRSPQRLSEFARNNAGQCIALVSELNEEDLSLLAERKHPLSRLQTDRNKLCEIFLGIANELQQIAFFATPVNSLLHGSGTVITSPVYPPRDLFVGPGSGSDNNYIVATILLLNRDHRFPFHVWGRYFHGASGVIQGSIGTPPELESKEGQGLYCSAEEDLRCITDAETRQCFEEIVESAPALFQSEYAFMLLEGKGGPIDRENAKKYLKKAANKGHRSYKTQYAFLLIDGSLGELNLTEAAPYFEKAANEGDMSAQVQYIYMLSSGAMEKPDLRKARRYAKMAADQGSRYAREMYMSMLFKGEGASIQLEEAFRYGLMAAAQGSQFAQAYLPTILMEIAAKRTQRIQRVEETLKLKDVSMLTF